MFGIGPWEWFIVLVLALVVVGPRRLPEVARTLGRVATEVRRTTFDLRRTLEDELESEDRERRRTDARERRKVRDEELAGTGQTIPRPKVGPAKEPAGTENGHTVAFEEGDNVAGDTVAPASDAAPFDASTPSLEPAPASSSAPSDQAADDGEPA